MAVGLLGIPDPGIWLAYLLCLAATALCVIHAFVRRKDGVESPPSGAARAAHQKKIAEE